MRETRYFYSTEPLSGVLPTDEAAHAVRVLHLSEGDEVVLTDGRGTFYDAVIKEASAKRCTYNICGMRPWAKPWSGRLHIALAPTKNNDRTEWFAEKATEIGVDEITLLLCRNSERRVMREDRVEKILVAAMKQSHKALLPRLNAMTDFARFVATPFDGDKFIAHCHAPEDIDGGSAKPHLFDTIDGSTDTLVAIGPEGDFTIDEVREALSRGFRQVSLGQSRLRTETAALSAVQMASLRHRITTKTTTP